MFLESWPFFSPIRSSSELAALIRGPPTKAFCGVFALVNTVIYLFPEYFPVCSGCRFACNMTLWFDIFSSGGVGRTGVFCGISMMIERVKAEGVIDVFQTVQAMRLQRPAMVQTAVRLSINAYCFCSIQ